MSDNEPKGTEINPEEIRNKQKTLKKSLRVVQEFDTDDLVNKNHDLMDMMEKSKDSEDLLKE